jgi:hypothetical protein
MQTMEATTSHTNGVVKQYLLGIGQVDIYNNLMVATINEGITLTLERAFELIGISEIHFRNKNFVYITTRKNSYAVDPTIYSQIFFLENLKGIAIVSTKDIDAHNIKIEQHFYKKPMQLFSTLEDAKAWANNLLD